MRAEVETSVNLFLACVYVEYVLLFVFQVQFYHDKVLGRNPIKRILDYITTFFISLTSIQKYNTVPRILLNLILIQRKIVHIILMLGASLQLIKSFRRVQIRGNRIF